MIRKMRPIKVRFMEKVNKGKCWVWTGAINYRFGYGHFYVHGKGVQRAHRAAYELFVGKIPSGLMVLHKCDNRACVKPGHLFVGTAQDNTNDMIAKGRMIRGVQPQGSRHSGSKLTEKDIPQIRRLRAQGNSQQSIANKFRVSQAVISSILRGKKWTHV
jgi:hypothetical protein